MEGARPSHPHRQHSTKGQLSCWKGWGARLPPQHVGIAGTWAEREGTQAGRHTRREATTCMSARARPSPQNCMLQLSFLLSPPFKHQMRWPFGIKEAIATQEVARQPSTPPAFATQSVAARLPTLPPAAAVAPAARLVTVSWLSRSDREMEEQIEGALYEPWPRPASGRCMVEVYSPGFQTMEARAGVQGSRPVDRTDQARGINLVSAADDELVKAAIRNILPRMNRNVENPTSLVDARPLQDGGRYRSCAEGRHT